MQKMEPFDVSSSQTPTEREQPYPLDAIEDSLLVKDLNALTVREREDVYDEIHGVAKVAEETPEFRANVLQEFQVALAKVAKRKRKALDRALFLKPSIQSDEAFQLMFLRADRYDCAKAASRMAQFFDLKLHMFGEGLLVKKLTYQDLDLEGLEVASTWCMQKTKYDQAGRPGFFFLLQNSNCSYPEPFVSTETFERDYTL